jgi:hypothetical protein
MLKAVGPGLVLISALATTGCASNTHRLIAQRGASLNSESRRVTLMPQPQLNSEASLLRSNVTTALQQRGFQVVEADKAELTLVCNLEKNWKTTLRSVTLPYYGSTSYPGDLPGTGFDPWARSYYSQQVEDSVALKGIRLQFYDSAGLRDRRFEMAWEGYIEGGLELPPEKQQDMLLQLLDYYGRNFNGRVKFPQ